MEELKNKIVDIITNRINCDAIVLFGSYTRGTQNEESDIDIAIKIDDYITKKELYELSNLLADELKKDIDLVNLKTIENDGFRYEILINGETLYCKDEYSFDLYKLDVYREYLELNEARKEIIDEMKK